MGIFAQTFTRPRVLPQIYQMDKQGKGCFQTGRLQGSIQALGNAQEQTRYELRDYGASA